MTNAKLYLMSDSNAFGELVTEYRLRKNLSQRELAEKIKMSPTYINYVERGFNPSAKSGDFKASAKAVDKIAHALDIPLDEARFAAGYAPLHAPNEIRINVEGLSETAVKEILSFIKFKRESEKVLDNQSLDNIKNNTPPKQLTVIKDDVPIIAARNKGVIDVNLDHSQRYKKADDRNDKGQGGKAG